MSSISRHFKIRSMNAKLIIVSVLVFLFLAYTTLSIVTTALTRLEEELMTSRLQSDIHYIADVIGGEYWSLDDDGTISCGDVIIGDGTEEHANYEPFLKHQDKTGTFAYVFSRCSDEGLTWVGDNKTGYMQGHFLRVAGSTKNPDGSSLVGTYIDKKVADVLDAEDFYSGPANVNGNQIYCIYETLKSEDGEVVGCMVVGRNVSELEKQIYRAQGSVLSILGLCLLLSIIGLVWLVYGWVRSINKIEAYVNRIGEGELPEDKLDIKSKDEIGHVATRVNAMVDALREKERMGAELNVATDIQLNMLPRVFPDLQSGKGFVLYASMEAAKEVGGDLYDFFMVDEDHLALVVADVSGKGVPAALFMVIAKTLIKDHTQIGLSPSEVFKIVNNKLCDGNDAGLFVTGWLCIINLRTGDMDFVNAGHNPPLLKHGDSYKYLKTKPGLVLAVLEDYPYTCEHTRIEPGDKLFLYTDGITEATNSNNELYGENRLETYLNTHPDDNVYDILKGVTDDIGNFVGDAVQFDDMTMLMFDFIHYNE